MEWKNQCGWKKAHWAVISKGPLGGMQKCSAQWNALHVSRVQHWFLWMAAMAWQAWGPGTLHDLWVGQSVRSLGTKSLYVLPWNTLILTHSDPTHLLLAYLLGHLPWGVGSNYLVSEGVKVGSLGKGLLQAFPQEILGAPAVTEAVRFKELALRAQKKPLESNK